jgi:hypothetical protein
VVSFTLRPLHPREKAPDTCSIGDWVDARAGLDVVAKRRILASARNRTPIFQPVVIHCTEFSKLKNQKKMKTGNR